MRNATEERKGMSKFEKAMSGIGHFPDMPFAANRGGRFARRLKLKAPNHLNNQGFPRAFSFSLNFDITPVLLTGRKITRSMVELCSGPVRFSRAPTKTGERKRPHAKEVGDKSYVV
jgi:hypothetical protein